MSWESALTRFIRGHQVDSKNGKKKLAFLVFANLSLKKVKINV